MMYTIGVDIGGTHTDAVVVDRHECIIGAYKTATTADVTTAVIDALDTVMYQARIPVHDIFRIVIGTTHATNAILQGDGLAPVGVMRIAGHKPELPVCYDWPEYIRNAVLADCVTVDGGMQCDNTSLTSFDIQQVENGAERLVEAGAHAIVVNGVFSPLNPAHEQKAGDCIRDMYNELPVIMGHDIGGIGFVERENAAILNAALRTILSHQLTHIERHIRIRGIHAPVYVCHNDGSVLSISEAVQYPIFTVSAGPTNSFIGGARLAGVDRACIADVGGTSTDIGVVTNTFARRSFKGACIAGIPLHISAPDTQAIAIGGGSHVQIREHDIHIAPQSCGNNIQNEAYVYGGNTMILFDMATVCKGTDASIIPALPARNNARQVMETASKRIASHVYDMIGVETDMPVVIVGGSAPLLSSHDVSPHAMIPVYASYANAYGAALAEVSGTVDVITSLDDRDETLTILQQRAVEAARQRGARDDAIRIVSVDIMPYYYMPGNRARVRISAAGPHIPQRLTNS